MVALVRIGLSLGWIFGVAHTVAPVPVVAGVRPPRVRQTPAVPRISVDTLHAYGNAVLVVDVRDVDTFQSGHIPGAINVPLAEVAARADEIRRAAKDRPIVTYCSCPAEHTSAEAARQLIGRGVPARALTGGFPAWLGKGLPIEKGAMQKR